MKRRGFLALVAGLLPAVSLAKSLRSAPIAAHPQIDGLLERYHGRRDGGRVVWPEQIGPRSQRWECEGRDFDITGKNLGPDETLEMTPSRRELPIAALPGISAEALRRYRALGLTTYLGCAITYTLYDRHGNVIGRKIRY